MKKVLFVSWQGMMGHITRDVAIVKELRRQNSQVEVSWIAHPLACKVLAQASEPIRCAPACASAKPKWARCSRISDSPENDENVVRPPKKPVTSSSRSSSLGVRSNQAKAAPVNRDSCQILPFPADQSLLGSLQSGDNPQ